MCAGCAIQDRGSYAGAEGAGKGLVGVRTPTSGDGTTPSCWATPAPVSTPGGQDPAPCPPGHPAWPCSLPPWLQPLSSLFFSKNDAKSMPATGTRPCCSLCPGSVSQTLCGQFLTGCAWRGPSWAFLLKQPAALNHLPSMASFMALGALRNDGSYSFV